MLDKDAFAAFKERRDICDKDLAKSFRYDLLAQGGQKPGMDMYLKFRGAAPDKKPMLRARGLWKDPEPVDSLQQPTHETPKPVFRPQPGTRPVNAAAAKAEPKEIKPMEGAKPIDAKKPVKVEKPKAIPQKK